MAKGKTIVGRYISPSVLNMRSYKPMDNKLPKTVAEVKAVIDNLTANLQLNWDILA